MAPSLPTETIHQILHELRPDASETVAATLSVSAISQHWRAVALSMPSLWSTIPFCLRTDDEAMLTAFLERSLRAPLHLIICFEFPSAAHIDAVKIQRALMLFHRDADRIEHLHLRFLTTMHDQSDLLGRFVYFQSSGLKSLEIESLIQDNCGRDHLNSDLWPLVTYRQQSWSERCPALTHVGCTDPRLFVSGPSNMTHLCIKGVLGGENILEFDDLRYLLYGTKITELVVDGVSLIRCGGGYLSLPHLHTLSLRSAPLPDGTIAYSSIKLAALMRTLKLPALVALTIHDPEEDIPGMLLGRGVHIPSITRFTTVTCSSLYPSLLPGVEELFLMGSYPQLDWIVDLEGDGWPSLHTIDLTKMEPLLPQHVQVFAERLYAYGRRRSEVDHGSQVLVRLPRGILPCDFPPDVGEFMDLRAA